MEQPQAESAPKQTEIKPKNHPVSPQLYRLRKYFVYVIVGGLIISALIAIIAVLAGNMSGIIGKTIETVIVVIIHSLVALGFISVTSSKQPNKGSSLVVNTLFGITVLSFIISMLSTWDILTDGEFIARTYMMFFTAFMTSVAIYGLFQSNEHDKSTVLSRNTAIGSSLTLFVLLVPVIYSTYDLFEFYYRLITAVSIVVGVSIVITVIFHWYFMSKHPELRHSGGRSQPLSIGQMIGRGILIVIGIWIFMAIIFNLLSGLASRYQEQPHRQTRPSTRYY